LQLLAALLITRQVMGNLKESLLPYAKKQLKLAKMSFDLFGALSPSTDRGMLETETRKGSQAKKTKLFSIFHSSESLREIK
jgi:anoctamin-8